MGPTAQNPCKITAVHDPFPAKTVAPTANVESTYEWEDVADDGNIDMVLGYFILDSCVVFFVMNQVVTCSVWKIEIIDARLVEKQLAVTNMIQTTKYCTEQKYRLQCYILDHIFAFSLKDGENRFFFKCYG